MAVQKSRKTRSKRDMRRGYVKISPPELTEERASGELHIRHHVSADGYYRGVKIPGIKSQSLKKSKSQEQQ